MDKKTQGSWLVFQASKLQGVTNAVAFDRTYAAGKSGIFLSAISQDKQAVIDNDRKEALAKASGIGMLEMPTILDSLRKQGLIDIGTHGIEVLGVTTESCLSHTYDLFSNMNPTSVERAALELCEIASDKPQIQKEMEEKLSDEYSLSNEETDILVKSSIEIGFVDKEYIDGEKDLLFNGNIFRRDEVKKVLKVLSSLSEADNIKYKELEDHFEKNACIDINLAKNILGEGLFGKLSSVGVYDINIVSNEMEEVAYLTRPSAFSKYSNAMVDDAFDLAKIFVSSLTYGMTRSSYNRGSIRMIEALMEALIRGEAVGPVKAIGEDYRALEMRNVVKVFDGVKKGRTGPMMILLKKDVGELALEVIKSADVSQHSLIAFPSSLVNKYRGPEVNRSISRKRQMDLDPKSTRDIISALRTGGK